MKIPVNIALFFSALCFLISCKTNTKEKADGVVTNIDTAKIDGHPAWIMQGNIYEVNVRQYSPEGTFKAFEASLQRLKDMGVQTLWFMPITPISLVDRKGVLGSYYAASDYVSVNPEFGTMDDWKSLVKKCHELGFKVITDWVPNHTGADHRWLTDHPDFYKKDPKTGKAAYVYDWTDTRKLDYSNPALQDSMIGCMKYWITNSDIDGFRCDVAGEVPDEFWKKCIPELRKMKNIFMLAEGNKPELQSDGFDATYTWNEFAMLKMIAKGERPAFAFDSVVQKINAEFPANSLLMYFTSNHDENSWNKADYGTTPGTSHAPFAVLTQTMGKSVPLIYSGQEEPFLDSISFFYKDTILFGKYARAPFYKTLLNLRMENPALAANAAFTKIKSSNDAAVYAYTRQVGARKVLVLLNLSNKLQNFTLTGAAIAGRPKNVFTGADEELKDDQSFKLDGWGYTVYSY